MASSTDVDGDGYVDLLVHIRRAHWSGSTPRTPRLVFARADGRPFDPMSLYRVVRLAGERARIPWPVGLHTFRHSCAPIMFPRGVPKEAIRRRLGHHVWEFTAGTYVHLDDDDLPDGAIVGDLVAHDSILPLRDVGGAVPRR